MAVDYGVKSTPKSVEAKIEPPVATVSAVNVESIFLALLTAQTTFAGGNKYWANPKNVAVNVARLKVLAKQIVEAY